MSVRMEQWDKELLFLHTALSLREKTAKAADGLVVDRMKIEDLFRRRRVLEEQEVETAARMRGLQLDIEAVLQALLEKVELLHARREFFLDARQELRRWRRNPAREIASAVDFGRIMEQIAEVAGHPECEEIVYELQELQLELAAAEQETMDIQLRREELTLEAEALEEHLRRRVDQVEAQLSSLFFARPRAVATFFLHGRKPDPKAKNVL